jgi:hypothetical protein
MYIKSCVVEGLDLAAVVRKMQYYKSGLPPGAGSGSGEHIRRAAKTLVPLLIDLGALKRERARLYAQAFVQTLRQYPITKAPILTEVWSGKVTFRQVHDQMKPSASGSTLLVSNNTQDATSRSSWMSVVTGSLVEFDVLDFDNFVVKDSHHVDQFADFECNWGDTASAPLSPVVRERAPSWAMLPDAEEVPQKTDVKSIPKPVPTVNPSPPTTSNSASMMPSQGSSKPDWDPFWSQNSGDPFASSDPFNTPPTDPFASQIAVIDPFANEDITQSYTPHQGAASSGGMDLLNFSDMNVTAPQGAGSRQDKISAMMSDFSSFDTLSQPKRSNNQGHASVAASRQPSTFPNGGNAKQPAKINSDPFADLFSM